MSAEPIQPFRRRCPQCDLLEEERDAALYAKEQMAERLTAAESAVAAAKTINRAKYKYLVSRATLAHGYAHETRFAKRFEDTVNAVLAELDITVVDKK